MKWLKSEQNYHHHRHHTLADHVKHWLAMQYDDVRQQKKTHLCISVHSVQLTYYPVL